MTLDLSNSLNQNLNFTLIDIQGKILMTLKINDHQTKINFAEIPAGNYFMSVSENNTILKTFKIIKY